MSRVQGRVQNLVAVVLEVGRLCAAWGRLMAVEEEEDHGLLRYSASVGFNHCLSNLLNLHYHRESKWESD